MIKAERPEVLAGITVKVKTSCGNMYVQLNWHEGKLFEVFATLGKAGGCATCQIEALTRSVTVGLRYGIPYEEYINQLQGICCPSPVSFPKEHRVLSCPDAIAKVLVRYGNLSPNGITFPQISRESPEEEEQRAIETLNAQMKSYRGLENELPSLSS